MDSGLSDSGDTGDMGLLLSKYSSKSLQVDMNTFFSRERNTNVETKRRDLCFLTRCV